MEDEACHEPALVPILRAEDFVSRTLPKKKVTFLHEGPAPTRTSTTLVRRVNRDCGDERRQRRLDEYTDFATSRISTRFMTEMTTATVGALRFGGRIVLRVASQCGSERQLQYQPKSYGTATRLLLALELYRLCGEDNDRMLRQHVHYVEACLEPATQTSRQTFQRLCNDEEVGVFSLLPAPDSSATFAYEPTPTDAGTYYQRCVDFY